VVPEIGRDFGDVCDDEAERERQIEKQETFRHDGLAPAPSKRGDEERDEQSYVLEPEPQDVLLAAVPTERPLEEAARVDCARARRPPPLRQRQHGGYPKECVPQTPTPEQQGETRAHNHQHDERVCMCERQQTSDEACAEHAAQGYVVRCAREERERE